VIISIKYARGFTLLEIIVVLLLIGIILSFAVLSIGDGGVSRRQTQEAQRFVALLRLAQEEALLRQTQIGVAMGRHGYRFMRQSENSWLEFSDDVFRARALPEGLSFALQLEGVMLPLAETPARPQILLFASGEILAFECRLYSAGQSQAIRISAAFNGIFTLTPETLPTALSSDAPSF
jgi:general secretion pathway protein H